VGFLLDSTQSEYFGKPQTDRVDVLAVLRNVHSEVKPLSPHHRFVIALHSPDGVFETGLLGCPAEKNAAKLACSVEQDTFSSPVSERELRNCAHFLQFPEQSRRISLTSRG
jgi:hypothetical protein